MQIYSHFCWCFYFSHFIFLARVIMEWIHCWNICWNRKRKWKNCSSKTLWMCNRHRRTQSTCDEIKVFHFFFRWIYAVVSVSARVIFYIFFHCSWSCRSFWLLLYVSVIFSLFQCINYALHINIICCFCIHIHICIWKICMIP